MLTDAAEGMAASIRAGARAARAAREGAAGAGGASEGAALMVLLPDMPGIDAADLARMLADFDPAADLVLRGAGADGRPGHPVIFPATMRAALMQVRGDTGARDLLRDRAVRLIPLPGQHAIQDLDTPEDWEAWRARTP